MKKYFIGVDIGGTTIKIGVVNENGEIVMQDSFDPKACKTGDSVVSRIATGILEIIKLLKSNSALGNDTNIGRNVQIHGIGICSPGSVDVVNGSVIFAGNLPFKNQEIVRPLKKLTGIDKIMIANDADAAALGEAKFGAGKEFKDSATITLGTGVGGGVIHNGKIFGGRTVKTELGHQVIDISPQAEPCNCVPGKKGCWEAYASATALIKQIQRAMAAAPDKSSLLWKACAGNIVAMNPKIAFECAEDGDELAKQIIDNYIRNVGVGLVNIGNSFGPQALIIGGGISNQGKNLITPLQDYVSKNLFPCGFGIKVLQAQLGDKAGIIGAAALVMNLD